MLRTTAAARRCTRRCSGAAPAAMPCERPPVNEREERGGMTRPEACGRLWAARWSTASETRRPGCWRSTALRPGELVIFAHCERTARRGAQRAGRVRARRRPRGAQRRRGGGLERRVAARAPWRTCVAGVFTALRAGALLTVPSRRAPHRSGQRCRHPARPERLRRAPNMARAREVACSTSLACGRLAARWAARRAPGAAGPGAGARRPPRGA